MADKSHSRPSGKGGPRKWVSNQRGCSAARNPELASQFPMFWDTHTKEPTYVESYDCSTCPGWSYFSAAELGSVECSGGYLSYRHPLLHDSGGYRCGGCGKHRTSVSWNVFGDSHDHQQSLAEGGCIWHFRQRHYYCAPGWSAGEWKQRYLGFTYCPGARAECNCEPQQSNYRWRGRVQLPQGRDIGRRSPPSGGWQRDELNVPESTSMPSDQRSSRPHHQL